MHIPVLLDEVIYYLDPKLGENFIDCTVGEGGHALAILERIGPEGKLLGIDLDREALKRAGERLSSESRGILSLRSSLPRSAPLGVTPLQDDTSNVILVQKNYKNLIGIKNAYFNYPIHGILLDLGFSSTQIEDGIRGFSFLKEGPLKMNYESGIMNYDRLTAEEIVNEWKEEELVRIFREYGEERQVRKIAKAICEERKEKRVGTTKELADLVLKALGRTATGSYQSFASASFRRTPSRMTKHPVTKIFQALRIAVNDELNNLKKVLPQALDILQPGGRLVIISFHSLEDRIVKEFFKKESKDCVCPLEIPICCCNHKATLKILTKKVIKPGKEEVKKNPRSRSARLRAMEKI